MSQSNDSTNTSFNRRTVLGALALIPAVLLLPKILKAATPAAAPADALGEKEPLANAMKYVADASKAGPERADKKANCFSCAKFNKCSAADPKCKTVAKDAAYAPCELFAGKVVSKAGWCLSWAKA